MKEEKKRYMIVEFATLIHRVCNSEKELDNLLDSIRKNNNRKNEKYICGNIFVEKKGGKHYVTARLYHKLTDKNKISDLDNFTKNFTSYELECYFAPKSVIKDGFKPDINIAYFESKNATDKNKNQLIYGINYIPVLYKEDLKYIDEKYIIKCLEYHAEHVDVAFFTELANKFSTYHIVDDYVEKLYELSNKIPYSSLNKYMLSHYALELYKKLIPERAKDGSILRDENGEYIISERRKRDFVFFIKNYGSRKVRTPLDYNEKPTKIKKEYLIKLRERLLEREDIKTLTLN